jgi:hypothetical protein
MNRSSAADSSRQSMGRDPPKIRARIAPASRANRPRGHNRAWGSSLTLPRECAILSSLRCVAARHWRDRVRVRKRRKVRMAGSGLAETALPIINRPQPSRKSGQTLSRNFAITPLPGASPLTPTLARRPAGSVSLGPMDLRRLRRTAVTVRHQAAPVVGRRWI